MGFSSSGNLAVVNLILRTTLRGLAEFNKRRYCKDAFNFFSKTIPVNTKIPGLPQDRKISNDLIAHLERISLVNFGDERGIKIVEDAVSYADQLEEVNTDGVEPLYSVIENESLYLRDDAVVRDVKAKDLLSHSQKICEGYYVAPAGNIPYIPDSTQDLNTKSEDNANERRASEGIKSCPIQKMLKHFETFNFLKYAEDKMIKGYNGENVKQIVQNEWLISNSIMCDEPSFISSCVKKSNLKSAYSTVKSMVKDLPCGIISSYEIDKSTNNSSESSDVETLTVPGSSDASTIINNSLRQKDGLQLEKFIICESNASDSLFYKLIRDREKWWKKFSASPGRFTLSQVHTADNEQFVKIKGEFPWKTVTVEIIRLFPQSLEHNEETGNKTTLHVLSCQINLEQATTVFLCDAYEGPEETGKAVLRFHRKLAPYKVAFSAIAHTPKDEQNLKNLALLLTKQIRKNCISVLLLPDLCSSPLEEQIIRNDSIGIPYTVILTEKTLMTGLLEIRSRDTTLKEQSHVGSLAPYVRKLMENY